MKLTSDKPFLVIGRAGMDFYPQPVNTKTEHATEFFACLGGSSANICVALVKHGCRASLVTRVSDDAVGRFCLNQLDHYGVDRQFVSMIGGEARNSLAVSECTVDNHETVIYRNGAADFEMTIDDFSSVPWSEYAGVITTGTVLAAEPSRGAAFSAFDRARAAGLPLIFDVDYRPYSWKSAEDAAQTYSRAASLCDVIIGNDVEFGFMAGHYDQGLVKARSLARSGADIVVYKRGEKGAITFVGEDELSTGIYPAEAIKPTGAGDSFLGGFIASIANGYGLEESILRGSACASMVVTRVGCAPAMPTAQELEAFLAAHPGPVSRD